ncbi:MAG: ABC transporter substrate-binding protein [Dethiosulfovibrio peptidovorans]|nr:MAG: ABC transporter substrate-binding protein [Dethiosulfovibrio peptidovorans]
MNHRISAVVLSVCLLLLTTGAIAADTSFTDQAGNTVTLSKPVNKAVTIPIPSASMFIAIDGTHRLAGMHRLSKSAMDGFLLGTYFPEALKIRHDVVGEGFMPNAETLLAIDPDIVFQWGTQGERIVEPIRNAGLTVALFKYGTQEYLEGWLSMFGTILDKKDKSEAILAWHHDTRKALTKATAKIPETERPRVLYFLRYGSGLKVAGANTYNDFSISLAGGQNVAHDAAQFAEVNEEQILLWDPEIILINGFEKGVVPNDVYTNPKLASVSAVKNRRVYKMPLGGYRWDPPNQESPLAWKWLSMVFHPDRFHWNLRGEIAEKHKFLYNHIPSDDDLDMVLRMDINGDSAGYAIFNKSSSTGS